MTKAHPEPEWISPATAQALLAGLSPTGMANAYASLLDLASEGLVRCRADIIRLRPCYARPEGAERYDPLDSKQLPSLDGRLIFLGLKRLHLGEPEAGDSSCLLTGTFRFGQIDIFKTDGRDMMISARVEIFGMKFSFEDVRDRFGLDGGNRSGEQSRPAGNSRKGQGSFLKLDEPLLMEMRELIASGKALTANGAANLIGYRAPGGGAEASRISRLARRYREWIKQKTN